MQTTAINGESLARKVGLGLLLFLVLRLCVTVFGYLQSTASIASPLIPEELRDVLLTQFEVRITLLALGIAFCGGFLYIRKPGYAVVSAVISIVLVPVFGYVWDLVVR